MNITDTGEYTHDPFLSLEEYAEGVETTEGALPIDIDSLKQYAHPHGKNSASRPSGEVVYRLSYLETIYRQQISGVSPGSSIQARRDVAKAPRKSLPGSAMRRSRSG